MRLIAIIFLLLFIAAGIVFGALNADLASFDLGFAQLSLPKGGAMLSAVLLGWILGGVTARLGTSLGHRRRRRRERKVESTTTA
ncbi:DUF1049 domain-containing protein [Luteibacter sp. Lutesp34]|uniref:DUF1049 domain-containing protein n=1 Tax=Luteibacter sp. Lutesp34 TaxID=3243030 RepID=UPI0039B5693C